MSDITRILAALDAGDPRAAGELLPLVYDELRRLAAQKLAQEKPGQTLEPTALVHEAYLRLAGNQASPPPLQGGAGGVWQNRRHFFAAAAEAMRRILIDNARRRTAEKRGGGRQRQELHPDLAAVPEPDEELLALDEALAKLALADPLKARLVELRFFAGLTGDQAAAVLDISPSTADRHWVFARAWLRRELGVGQDGTKI